MSGLTSEPQKATKPVPGDVRRDPVEERRDRHRRQQRNRAPGLECRAERVDERQIEQIVERRVGRGDELLWRERPVDVHAAVPEQGLRDDHALRFVELEGPVEEGGHGLRRVERLEQQQRGEQAERAQQRQVRGVAPARRSSRAGQRSVTASTRTPNARGS
jgi:hypothetical protein